MWDEVLLDDPSDAYVTIGRVKVKEVSPYSADRRGRNAIM